MQTKLILIRHGETIANRKKRFVGSTNPRLTKTGIKQAKTLKNRIKSIKVDAVYSSDRLRTKQTARLVFPCGQINTCQDLREIHFGAFEGKTHNQLLKTHKDTYEAWLKSPFKTIIPGGEAFVDFKKRVLNKFKNIALIHKNQTAAIITHAGPMFIIFSKLTKSKILLKEMPKLTSAYLVNIKGKKTKISQICK